MKEATFDPAKELRLYFRCNRAGSKNFVFTYSNGTAYSFIYDELELNIYKNQGDKKKLISLTHVSGITLNSNTVTASITKALSNIPEGEYYWELYRTDLEKTWLTGDAIFHNGKFDGVGTSTETITVTEDGDDVNITIQEAGTSVSAATQAQVNTGTSTDTYVSPATLAAKALKTGTYSTELTFDTDKDIYQDVTSPTFTLAASGNINGVGIILRLNTPTSVTFPANFEAHANSATLDATKLNVYTLVYFSNWNGSGTARVIYTNSLFTAI